jgi:hypothetical protein
MPFGTPIKFGEAEIFDSLTAAEVNQPIREKSWRALSA